MAEWLSRFIFSRVISKHFVAASATVLAITQRLCEEPLFSFYNTGLKTPACVWPACSWSYFSVQVCGGQMGEKEKWTSLSSKKKDGSGDTRWRGVACCEWPALGGPMVPLRPCLGPWQQQRSMLMSLVHIISLEMMGMSLVWAAARDCVDIQGDWPGPSLAVVLWRAALQSHQWEH